MVANNEIKKPLYLFVTGTDTDAGKTTCASALLHALHGQGRRVWPFKPVAAGAEAVDGQLRNSDALKLMNACAIEVNHENYAKVNPYCYAPPIAPHIAAAQVKSTPTVRSIIAKLETALFERQNAKSHDLVLIEGAGGWLVPLNDEESLADVAKALQADVLLVIGMKLGCLSHALLTVEAIQRRGLKLAGWIANQPQPAQMAHYQENLETLKRLIDAPCLGEVPFQSNVDETALVAHINVRALQL